MISDFILDKELGTLELKRLNRLRSAYDKLVVEQAYPILDIWATGGEHMASSDGRSYITINRKILTYSISYYTIISALNIVHELTHYKQTTEELDGDETHTKQFYKMFHDTCFVDLSEIIYQISIAR